MGRPTKRTPERIELVIAAMENGSTLTDAAGAAGISPDTLVVWRKADPDLAEQLERATARCAARMARCITDVAETDWRAALAWLERRRPDEWSLRQSRELDTRIEEMLAALSSANSTQSIQAG